MMDIISAIVGLGIFAVIIGILLALLPGIIAFSRDHQYKWVILLVGFFGSAFFIPWIAMVIWASWPRKSTLVDPLVGSPTGLDNRNVGTVAGEIRNQYDSTRSAAPSSGDTNSFREAFDGERTLSNDAYKLFLLKKYKIKKDDVLEAYVVSSKIFKSLDEAFSYLADLEERRLAARAEREQPRPQQQEQAHNAALRTASSPSASASTRHPGPMIALVIGGAFLLGVLILTNKVGAVAHAVTSASSATHAVVALTDKVVDISREGAPPSRSPDPISGVQSGGARKDAMGFDALRETLLTAGWQPIVREIRDHQGRTLREDYYCYEQSCFAEFTSPSDPRKVRLVRFQICDTQGYGGCPGRLDGFKEIFMDNVVDRRDADREFALFKDKVEPDPSIRPASVTGAAPGAIAQADSTGGWSAMRAVMSDRTNVRSAGDLSAPVISQLAPGTQVLAKVTDMEWWEVRDPRGGPESGWVRKDRLERLH